MPALNASAKVFGGPEDRHISGWNRNRFSSAGVAALSCPAPSHLEGAKSPELDAVTRRERVAHGSEKGVDHWPSIVLGDFRANRLDDRLNDVGLSHPLPLGCGGSTRPGIRAFWYSGSPIHWIRHPRPPFFTSLTVGHRPSRIVTSYAAPQLRHSIQIPRVGIFVTLPTSRRAVLAAPAPPVPNGTAIWYAFFDSAHRTELHPPPMAPVGPTPIGSTNSARYATAT